MFVEHFRQPDAEYPDLPVWVPTEVTSFGSLSKMVGTVAADWRTRLHARLDAPPPLPAALAKTGMPQDWKANLEWR